MIASALSLLLLGTTEEPNKLDGLKFQGIQYLHRHSEGSMHEFTPKDQPNLEKWTDMVTINDYPSVTTGEALAKGANGVLDAYKGARGMIVRTSSVPRTEKKEAEHLIVALFIRQEYAEAAFARFLMVEGKGLSLVYSHRIYGKAPGKPMSEWLAKKGPQIEKSLMALRELPKR